MEKIFIILRQTRKNFLALIDGCTIEQLNEVPPGFNNNMIWNFGHIIASQQILCYKLSGMEMKIPAHYIAAYQKGTRPEKFIEQAELDELKALMFSTIDVLEDDLNNGNFVQFHPYLTSYGVQLNGISDAVHFFPIHDTYHFGVAASIKKQLTTDKK